MKNYLTSKSYLEWANHDIAWRIMNECTTQNYSQESKHKIHSLYILHLVFAIFRLIWRTFRIHSSMVYKTRPGWSSKRTRCVFKFEFPSDYGFLQVFAIFLNIPTNFLLSLEFNIATITRKMLHQLNLNSRVYIIFIKRKWIQF